MGMLLLVQLLRIAVDSCLLHVLRDVEEVAHLLQQLQLKAEHIAHNLQQWSEISLEGKQQVSQETQQQVLHGEERKKHLVHALQWI